MFIDNRAPERPEYGIHPLAAAAPGRWVSPPAALRPVVFLPGLLCDQGIWRAQVNALSDVVAPVVPDLTLDDSVQQMASRVLAVAPPRFALVGLSMGGYVALEIMRQAPERVSRLALLDTSARPDTIEKAARRRDSMDSLRRGRFVGITGPLLRRLLHPDHASGPAGEELRAMAGRVGGAAFLRQQRAILHRPDYRSQLPGITVRTLVGVGDHDLVTPLEDAREMRQAIPHAMLHVFEQCGHLPAIERPSETTVVLRRWLADAEI